MLWSELKAEVKRECNIETETFVTDDELLVWANDAKKIIDQEIVSLYDKYFETYVSIGLVAGQKRYAPPVEILASKITGVYNVSNSTAYEVLYQKDKFKALTARAGDLYTYRMINDYTEGPMIEIYPSPTQSGEELVVYHIRKSVSLVDDNSLIDSPLGIGFIKQYIKDKVKEAELGPLSGGDFSPQLVQERRLFIEALNDMIPDDTRSQIEPDVTYYEDCL